MDKVTRQCPQTTSHNLLKRNESRSGIGPAVSSQTYIQVVAGEPVWPSGKALGS